MDKFFFNLQRFNEDATEETVEQLESGDSTEESGQPKAEFRLDENGRIQFIHDDEETDETDEAEDETDPDEEEAEDSTPAKQEQADSQYTPQEMKDLDFEDLDPKKIPEAMLPWYRSMQSGFTRKMQQLSEKERALKAPEQPAPQEEGTPDPKAHIKGLASLARFQACQVLEIDPDEFDRTDDDHEAAYQIALLRINQAVDETVHKERALVTFDEDMASADPEYYKIKQWAKDSYIGRMPYDDRMGFETAVRNSDTKALERKYFPMLKEAYEKENGISKPKEKPIEEVVKSKSRVVKTPPSLEASRNSEKQVDKGFNPEQLKGKTMQEQVALLMKAGLAKP
jgi:hypothetical protein